MYLKFVGLVANSADPAQMLYSAASDLGLHCLFRSVYLSEYLREILYNNYGWNQQHICFMEIFRVQTCYILRTKMNPSMIMRGPGNTSHTVLFFVRFWNWH